MKNFSLIVLSGLLISNLACAEEKASSEQQSIIEYKKNTAVSSSKASKKDSTKKSDIGVVQSRSKTAVNCPVHFSAVEDFRNNKLTVGTDFKKSLQPIGIPEWLLAAEQDLWISRVKAAETGSTIEVKPKLTKLYAYAQSLNIHGMIAFEVDFLMDGKLVANKKYRGLGSTTNGWNADYEYYDAMSYAAHTAFPKVLTDIVALCDKKTI